MTLKPAKLILLLLLVCLPMFVGFFGEVSSLAIKSDEPASEGRPITPAGTLIPDLTTRQPAVGALTVDFVRSPDRFGPDGQGRYLIAVNSGYGVQFSIGGNKGQQSLSVIDLNVSAGPAVIQNVYFPSPQSANVGVAFGAQADEDGSYPLYVAGGFENKIWIFRFTPTNTAPITPLSAGPSTTVDAPFIDVTGFAEAANSPRYNSNHAPVYPTGIALSPDGDSLFVANNLGDSLGIVSDLRGARRLERIALSGRNRQSEGGEHFTYPYAVVALPHPPFEGRASARLELSPVAKEGRVTSEPARTRHEPGDSTYKVYVSCWNDDSVAVIDFTRKERTVSYLPVGRHPTAMIWDGTRSRLYV